MNAEEYALKYEYFTVSDRTQGKRELAKQIIKDYAMRAHWIEGEKEVYTALDKAANEVMYNAHRAYETIWDAIGSLLEEDHSESGWAPLYRILSDADKVLWFVRSAEAKEIIKELAL